MYIISQTAQIDETVFSIKKSKKYLVVLTS